MHEVQIAALDILCQLDGFVLKSSTVYMIPNSDLLSSSNQVYMCI